MGTFTTAWKAFWTILGSDRKAQAWKHLNDTPELPAPGASAPAAEPAQDTAQAVHVLALLQRESRLVDFLMEDISGCEDEQIGTAVRKLHDDARDALQKYFGIEPVQDAPEGETITLPEDFDNRQNRLTGRPVQEPPYTGTLLHRGWKAANINLPVTSAALDPTIITPAEIDIP